jgi:hypothetical protein
MSQASLRQIATGPLHHMVALALGVALAITFAAEALPRYAEAAHPEAGLMLAVPTFLIPEDGVYYRAAVLSMLQDGDLDLRNNFAELGDQPQMSVALGRHGEWYPKHPILMPLLSLPFYIAGRDPGLLAFNVAALTVLGLLIWACARRHAGDDIALAVTILYAFSTLLRPMAYHFSPDVLSAALFLGGYTALVARRCALAGLLMGLAVWAKVPNLVLLPMAGVYSVWVLGRRDALRFALAASIPLLIVAGLNAYMFGSPFLTGYDRVIERVSGGVPQVMPSHRTFFTLPFWRGLATQVFDTRLGLLISAPVLVAGVAGMFELWMRDRAETLLIASVAAAQLGFFARYRYWNITSTGHRFLLITIVISAIPAAALLDALLARFARR